MQPSRVSAFRAIFKLAAFFRQQWFTATCGILLLLASSAATVITPRLLGWFVDALKAEDAVLVPHMLILYAANELLRVAASGSAGFLLTLSGQRMLHRLRTAIMDHMLRLRVAAINERTPAALVSHITTDVGALTELFSTGFVEGIEKILIVIGITVSILTLNLKLGTILLAAFVFLFAAAVVLTTILHRYYKELRESSGELQRILGETLLGIPTIRLFDLYEHRDSVLQKASDEYAEALLRPARGFACFHPVVTLVNGISMALLVWVGGGMVLDGEISFGTLVAMSSYILWLFWPIVHIVDRWNVMLAGSAAAQRIFDLLAIDAEKEEAGSENLPRPLKGEVSYNDVEFRYLPDAPLFTGLNFSVKPGERVAIVGATGSGKTTIANLLLRLWEVNSGTITLDGIPASKVGIAELRRRFGLIEQELFLFTGTIGDNITLWDSAFPERLALLRKELPELPDFNLAAEERGANLSMGERQLVSLARALYSQPEILILDEATAHLDPILDKRLQAAMRELAKNATTFVIAHRLSSITDADKIFVLHHGALVETGTHDDLIAMSGIYSTLYAIELQQQR